MKQQPHKYDIGTYSVQTFTGPNRQRKTWLLHSYTAAVNLAKRWHRRTGGSAVVRRTLYNTAMGEHPKWAPNPNHTKTSSSTPAESPPKPSSPGQKTTSGGSWNNALMPSENSGGSGMPCVKSGTDPMRIKDEYDYLADAQDDSPSHTQWLWLLAAILLIATLAHLAG